MKTRATISGADATAIAGVLAMSSAAMAGPGGEPFNDEFPGDIYAAIDGGIVIVGDLEDRGCGYGGTPAPAGKGVGLGYGGGCFPDTTLGIFGSDGSLLETDDDESFLGDGLASGLYGIEVGPKGFVEWAVSGYPDFDFDGFVDGSPGEPHFQSGAWEGYIDYFDDGGNFVGGTYMGFYEFFDPTEVFFGTDSAPPNAATFDIYLDNTVGAGDCICGDVDYQVVTSLNPGGVYEIRVTSADFDSILQTYDSGGSPLNFNDDDPDAGCCLSVLNEEADENGDIYFAISEINDLDFIGDHFAFGTWDIAVTEVCDAEIGCTRADIAEPFGLIDLADIVAFVTGFTESDCAADFDANGLYDLADITAFVNSFTGGCP